MQSTIRLLCETTIAHYEHRARTGGGFGPGTKALRKYKERDNAKAVANGIGVGVYAPVDRIREEREREERRRLADHVVFPPLI